jgi:LysR family transcriptional regulator, glycine cleavage system transcriptional activator
MKRLPPLHCLQALEAVARLGSVVAAADELCVTASAISHRLKQFEAWLGQPLIARPQPLTLTPHAIQYAVAARAALAGLEALPAPRPDSQQRLTVAVPPTFARNILVPRLSDFTAAHPKIEVELQLTIPLLDVKAGDPDVEVRFGPGHYADAGITEPLLADRVFPVAAPSYLQRVGELDSPAALRRVHLLRSPLEPWRPWLDAAGLDWPEPREGVQFNDLGLLMEAAVAGQGVALARRTIAQHWLAAGLLRRLFDLDAGSPHAYWLLYEQANLARPEVRVFIEWLRQTVRAAADGPR